MPKQWKLITLYMVIVYITILGIIHYAKTSAKDDAAAHRPMPFVNRQTPS
jgi:hypothetical protein